MESFRYWLYRHNFVRLILAQSCCIALTAMRLQSISASIEAIYWKTLRFGSFLRAKAGRAPRSYRHFVSDLDEFRADCVSNQNRRTGTLRNQRPIAQPRHHFVP